MPRHRTVRFAVLGSSVQRTATPGYPSNRSSAVKRRIVVGVLVLLSFVLITVSFRSSALDGVQGTAAGILRPFEIGADRIARPFRDTVGWFRGLVHAKSENTKLKRENQKLTQELAAAETQANENPTLRALLHYHAAPSESAFTKLYAEVLSNPLSVLDQSITIAAGTSDGVADGDVVRTAAGLVGVVDRAFSATSRVTLLTDGTSNVNAVDAAHPTSIGIVHRGGSGSTLVFDHVNKQSFVGVGDLVITAGTLGSTALQSLFPRGIPIGRVESESDNDVNPFHSIQLHTFVDFSSAIESVIVLVPKQQSP